MPRALRWGVLGCADIGLRAVVPAIQRARGAVVAAIASRDLTRARLAAGRLGIEGVHEGYQALLDDTSIDAVYIPLPNALHVPWALRAIERGKHVLCEKPLAITAEGVEEVRAAADRAGVMAMEAMMYRFHPQTRRVVQLVRSGSLGEVQLVSATFTYGLHAPGDIRLRRDLGGGVLWDVGSYCVHIARLAFGEEPEAAAGWARIGPDSDVDEVFAGSLRFARGMATFQCSLRGPRTQSYTITGSEASLRSMLPFAPGVDDRTLVIQRGWHRDALSEESEIVPGVDQYQLMIEHFVREVRSGRPASNVHLDDTRANVAAVQALMRSAEEGRIVRP